MKNLLIVASIFLIATTAKSQTNIFKNTKNISLNISVQKPDTIETQKRVLVFSLKDKMKGDSLDIAVFYHKPNQPKPQLDNAEAAYTLRVVNDLLFMKIKEYGSYSIFITDKYEEQEIGLTFVYWDSQDIDPIYINKTIRQLK